MKKIILSLIVLASAILPASAQYITTKEVGQAIGWTAYTSAPAAQMVGADYNSQRVIIFNDDFTEAESFAYTGMLGSLGDIIVTQHLFNEDDLYEIVCSEMSSDGMGIHYAVYNQNGERLGEIPTTNLMTVGTKNYIFDYDNSVYTLYAIEAAQEGTMSLCKVQGVTVYPNPATSGQMIRFEIPEAGISDVRVYDSNGVEKFRTVDAGSDAVSVGASTLGKGVHPYTVTGDDGKTHSGKLIVK